LKRCVRQFQRVEAIAFDVIRNKERRAIRVAVTQQDGVEVDHVLYVGSEEEPQAAQIEASIGAILQKTDRVGIVAASRALGKALSIMKSTAGTGATQASFDGRKTS
jgi:hypothetical protein